MQAIGDVGVTTLPVSVEYVLRHRFYCRVCEVYIVVGGVIQGFLYSLERLIGLKAIVHHPGLVLIASQMLRD